MSLSGFLVVTQSGFRIITDCKGVIEVINFIVPIGEIVLVVCKLLIFGLDQSCVVMNVGGFSIRPLRVRDFAFVGSRTLNFGVRSPKINLCLSSSGLIHFGCGLVQRFG